ncbi:MAG: sulfurtransferase TusA family protein [Sphingomonas sanxanigenens]|uniref:Sulfurtransferase TusA family protein n=1 Tax=Sphingomonas sanxanigenens TaxID=397260 RepID=A0A2W5ADX5_9SPHN|nr:MAG: sulfurtransferase TusA family protein [Sphingomonas sanxanigenens]
MRCPWPALRLARAMRVAEEALIVSDDPAAPREIDALAAEQGWSVVEEATAIGAGLRIRRRR